MVVQDKDSEMQRCSLLVAAPHSGSGKTTVTLGLLRALKNRGVRVQPFKVGPDYIDTLHHASAAGVPSYNLDGFMASSDHVKQLFCHRLAQAEVAVVEGVMGLFDGACRAEGSSAAMAIELDLPVILVVNAKAMAYSAAPLLWGFKNFDDRLNIAGVIFNQVGSVSHYKILCEAAHDVGITPLGYLPKDEQLYIGSRHLGLDLSDEQDYEGVIQQAAHQVEKYINLDLLLEKCSGLWSIGKSSGVVKCSDYTFAIARDEAFNFMYPATLDLLARYGRICFFSPLHDKELPVADMIWLPGGYPELYAGRLAQNQALLSQIKAYAEQGGALLAECGGMMVLGEAIHDGKKCYPMAGLFNYTTSIEQMKLTMGYRKILVAGEEFRGHEFHYSSLQHDDEKHVDARVTNARNGVVNMPVYRKGNAVASYMHLYLGEENKLLAWLRWMGMPAIEQ